MQSKQSSKTTLDSINRKDSTQEWLETTELEYPPWFTCSYVYDVIRFLPENPLWNILLCVTVLLHLMQIQVMFPSYELMSNAVYLSHVFAVALTVAGSRNRFTIGNILKTVLDFLPMLSYMINIDIQTALHIGCNFLRLHRPLEYLCGLKSYYLDGSILSTTLKYCYISLVVRVIWTYLYDFMEITRKLELAKWINRNPHSKHDVFIDNPNIQMWTFFPLMPLYVVDKIFIPIGPPVDIGTDLARCVVLLIGLSGCVVTSGLAIASLTLAISLYLAPQETFRTRFRLIIKEMRDTQMPSQLRDKVETFYRTYWNRQRGVSGARPPRLLHDFPPALARDLRTDIYFEALQKSKYLRNVSDQFLREIAQHMETVHYIPGDAIVQRCSRKTAMIYITYGDVEVVTAEDDATALLRVTRGSLLSAAAAAAPAACARAHVLIRAATFCTAHVLRTSDLWRVAVKRGRFNKDGAAIVRAFNEHFGKVVRHYDTRFSDPAKFRSSIEHLKQNLVLLKSARDDSGRLLLRRDDMFLQIAGCYVIRNREDVRVSDEADAVCVRPTFPCILQPHSALQLLWSLLICLLVLLVCFLHPYYLVFKKQVPLEFRVFDYWLTFVFIVDIFVYLSTGTNVEEGVPITFTQTSSQQMQNWLFLVDVLAVVPIFEFIRDGHYAGINKLLKFYKIFRMSRDLEEVCVYGSNAIRVASYTLLLLVAGYWLAAVQEGFMCHVYQLCAVADLSSPPYWAAEDHHESSIETRVIFSMYWAISLFSFTSHLETVNTDVDMMYTLVILEICCVLHVFIESMYSATIIVTTNLEEMFNYDITTVKNALRRSGIRGPLQERFTNYLELCWYTDKAFSMSTQKTIFYDLPSHVYHDILIRQRSKYLLCIPFMQFLNKEDLKQVSSNARIFDTSPNEILLNTGDYNNEIYVIKQGICEILSPITKKVVRTLEQKSAFGVIDCILRIPAYYTVRAVTHVRAVCVSRRHLARAMEDTPQLRDAIDYAKMQPEFQALQVRRRQFASYQRPAPAPNRQVFRLPRKHEPDTEFLKPFTKLGSFALFRYIFPRFTIRPDGAYIRYCECLRAIFAFTTAMIVPGYPYLVLQWPYLALLLRLLDITAYLDIIQRMVVGWYTALGVLVQHPASAASRYLRGAFLLDLAAALPLEKIVRDRQIAVGTYRVMRMEQVIMLVRLLQLYRLRSVLDALSALVSRRDLLLVIQSLPIMMMILNVLTCLLVIHSVQIHYPIEKDTGYNYILIYDANNSWITRFEDQFRFNITESPFHLHLVCYYWVVYEFTTTGYNNLGANTNHQLIILLIGVATGMLMTTYITVRIISTRANVNTLLAEYQEDMHDLRLYMEDERFTPELKRTMIRYYEHNWEMTGGIQMRNVLKMCRQVTLRTDVILHLYGATFAQCPLLSDCDKSYLRLLGRAARSVHFLPDTRLVEVDDVINHLFFVQSGCVLALEGEGVEDLPVELKMGSIFGNLEKSSTCRCRVAFVSKDAVRLLQIKSEAFYEIVGNVPMLSDKMKLFLADNKYYIEGLLLPEPSTAAQESFLAALVRRPLVRFLHRQLMVVPVYQVVVSLACIYLDLYNAGFQDNRTWVLIMLYWLDALFYVKVLVQWLLPFVVEDKKMKKSLKEHCKRYLRNEFFFDMLSVIPLELLNPISSDRTLAFSLLRLNRIFRIVTVYKCLNSQQRQGSRSLLALVVGSVLLWLTLYVHAAVCAWSLVGLVGERQEMYSSWMYKDPEPGQLPESWCQNKYMCSLYFVLSTVMQAGIGDILPRKVSEVMFVSILQIISTLLFIVYVGEFSNIIQYKSFRFISYYSKFQELQVYLKNNRVTSNMVEGVCRWARLCWRARRGAERPRPVRAAPHCLALACLAHSYCPHFRRNVLFDNCPPAFLRQLAGHVKSHLYDKGMYVVRAGEVTDSLYVVHRGEVAELSHRDRHLRTYNVSEMFGIEQGLQHNLPFRMNYRTTEKSLILSLNYDDWKELRKHFPVCKRSIYKHVGLTGSDDDDRDDAGSDDNDFRHEKYTLTIDPLDKEHQELERKASTLTSPSDNDTIDKKDLFTENVASPFSDATLYKPEWISSDISEKQQEDTISRGSAALIELKDQTTATSSQSYKGDTDTLRGSNDIATNLTKDNTKTTESVTQLDKIEAITGGQEHTVKSMDDESLAMQLKKYRQRQLEMKLDEPSTSKVAMEIMQRINDLENDTSTGQGSTDDKEAYEKKRTFSRVQFANSKNLDIPSSSGLNLSKHDKASEDVKPTSEDESMQQIFPKTDDDVLDDMLKYYKLQSDNQDTEPAASKEPELDTEKGTEDSNSVNFKPEEEYAKRRNAVALEYISQDNMSTIAADNTTEKNEDVNKTDVSKTNEQDKKDPAPDDTNESEKKREDGKSK